MSEQLGEGPVLREATGEVPVALRASSPFVYQVVVTYKAGFTQNYDNVTCEGVKDGFLSITHAVYHQRFVNVDSIAGYEVKGPY